MKSNLKIMRSKPEITESQIHEFMNFDRLLLDRKTAIRQKNLKRLRNAMIASVCAAIAVITFFLLQEDNSYQSRQPDPVIGPDTQRSALIQPDSVQHNKGEHKIIPVQPHVREKTRSSEIKPSTSPPKKEIIKDPVYVQSEPVDGFPYLYEYFRKELKYPDPLLKDSIQGVTTVVFTIDVNGRPQDLAIENSLGAAFDEEIRRIILNMPLWKPATYNGKPVNSKVSLPLTFNLEKIQKN